jgi:hypothetical protein
VILTFIVGFVIAWLFGWLPPSFVVPALFILGFVARVAPRRDRGRARRRGGYVKPPASLTQNPATIPPQSERVATGSFSSSSALGTAWEGEVIPPTPAEMSRLIALGWFGNAMGVPGASGVPHGDAA